MCNNNTRFIYMYMHLSCNNLYNAWTNTKIYKQIECSLIIAFLYNTSKGIKYSFSIILKDNAKQNTWFVTRSLWSLGLGI